MCIRDRYGIKLLRVTLGKDGSVASYNKERVFVPGFMQENTIETTGAGDTFGGSVLAYVCEHGIEHLTKDNLMPVSYTHLDVYKRQVLGKET